MQLLLWQAKSIYSISFIYVYRKGAEAQSEIIIQPLILN